MSSLLVVPVHPIVGMLGEGKYIPLMVVRPAGPNSSWQRVVYLGGYERPVERFNQAKARAIEVFKDWNRDACIEINDDLLSMSAGQFSEFQKIFSAKTTELYPIDRAVLRFKKDKPVASSDAAARNVEDPLQYAIDAYPAYWRPLPANWNAVDTYRIDSLYPLNDSRLTHARKKLLVPGVRTGGKSFRKDVKEAYETIGQWLKDNPDE